MPEKDKPNPPSTNDLLAQILAVSKDTNASVKQIQQTAVAQLKVANDTKDLTQQLVNAIVGSVHDFTIKIEQIHKAVVKK